MMSIFVTEGRNLSRVAHWLWGHSKVSSVFVCTGTAMAGTMGRSNVNIWRGSVALARRYLLVSLIIGLFDDLLDVKSGLRCNVDVSGPVDGAVGLEKLKDWMGEEFVFGVFLFVIEGKQRAVD